MGCFGCEDALPRASEHQQYQKATVQSPTPSERKPKVSLQCSDPDQALVKGTVQRFPSLFCVALVLFWSAHDAVKLSVFTSVQEIVCETCCFDTIETAILQGPVQRPTLNLKQGTSPKETRSNAAFWCQWPLSLPRQPPSGLPNTLHTCHRMSRALPVQSRTPT